MRASVRFRFHDSPLLELLSSVRRWSTLPRPILFALAAILAVMAILYSGLWMYYFRHQQPPVEFGFDNLYNQAARTMDVTGVYKGSPAEQAGLRAGDRILAVNGRTLETVAPFDDVWGSARPGDPVNLTVVHPGATAPVIIHGNFRLSTHQAHETIGHASALQVIGLFPILFLIVGLPVLFFRIDDPDAWLLALMFAGFTAAPDFPQSFGISAALLIFCFTYRAVFVSLLGSLFYLFFAVFPSRSALDRAAPWLKWAGLFVGGLLAFGGIQTGVPAPRVPVFIGAIIGKSAATIAGLSFVYGFIALGLISLVIGAIRSPDQETRRKTRVMFWGTVLGVLPIAVERAVLDFSGRQSPLWLDAAMVALIFIFPLSFAYAVVKHSVLEIPVLLKRSARYVFVRRGFAVLLVLLAVGANVLLTYAFSHFLRANTQLAMSLGVGFGISLAIVFAPVVRRSTERIDRAFFRSAYDARVILQDLAEKTRTVTGRHELAALLVGHVEGALHPKTLACFLEGEDGVLRAEAGVAAPALSTLRADWPLPAELVLRGKTWDLLSDPPGARNVEPLAALAPECLVPFIARDGHLLGLLALGQRLSEEPYSGEDKHLLDSVANQSAVALENIGLAEKMAERMDVERRSAQEMEIARQVQARLFPQKFPPLATLEYAGKCIQTRQVGGDYYDFLGLGAGQLGLVLADIAGKGISGALLMANLQANLRSQYATALDDLPGLLESVNRLFFENTTEEAYATFFLAAYDDASRRVRYANCGHLPALLLRADGNIERLSSTSTVLGLFQDWTCRVEETHLDPGDVLVLYTDGVTEASNAAGEDFGFDRLVDVLRPLGARPVSEMMDAVIAAVLTFSGGVQADDITLVVARCR